ncbi:MAG: uncharacterized protein JWM05_1104 [Acidimicrobiales bacterium]|nr:uncharacterized protein [Acidimicrobiales bacterium]
MSRPRTRPLSVVAFAATLLAAGCSGSSDGSTAGGSVPRARQDPSTAVAVPGGSAAGTTSSAGPSGVSATTVPNETTGSAITDTPKTAPPTGDGSALLTAVRVGRNKGFERIVFEFTGASAPGYRVRWVSGPITADGSGEPVDVRGPAHLQVIMEPASGVDMQSGKPTYSGPDRVPVSQAKLLRALVRTGDFENVLTWVAGASRSAPFRVSALRAPSRLVVDVMTGAAPHATKP